MDGGSTTPGEARLLGSMPTGTMGNGQQQHSISALTCDGLQVVQMALGFGPSFFSNQFLS